MGRGVVNKLEGRSGPSTNYDHIKKLLNEKVRMLQENTYRSWDQGEVDSQLDRVSFIEIFHFFVRFEEKRCIAMK